MRVFIRWIDRAAKTYETRPFDASRVLAFVVFIATARSTLEWVLAGLPVRSPLATILGHTSFYWLTFFSYGLVVKWCVPNLPWQRSINVVLFGLFLGLFPPLVDAAVYGLGHGMYYNYIRNFPTDWNVLFYNPVQKVNIGETAVIWATIFFSCFYVFLRTASVARTLLAFILAYAAVLFDGAVAANVARIARASLQWPGQTGIVFIVLSQLSLSMVLYLAYRPALLGHLARRVPHLLPFGLITLVGASLAGELSVLALIYASVVLLLAYTAAIQNDYFDGGSVVEAEDVKFFNIVIVMIVLVFFGVNATPTIAFMGIFVTAMLYNYPFFRGKQYFPANLKMEGVWGGLSFLVGVCAAREQTLAGGGYWYTGAPQESAAQAVKAPFSPTLIVAMALAFGGFSVLAALKDQKDIHADAEERVQTLYTLALAHKRSVVTAHHWLLGAATLCLAACMPLLALIGRIGWTWAWPGLAIALALPVVDGSPSRRGFYAFTGLVMLLLVLVLVALLP
jgi:4-hydroxybenzoate polyprenyltransferase